VQEISKKTKKGAKKPPKQEMSLPKLSFSDLLSRAPKPIQQVPKPHAPLIYIDQDSEMASQHDSRNVMKKLLATNSSDFMLKPEISHFTND
jgi:hypothetical protein